MMEVSEVIENYFKSIGGNQCKICNDCNEEIEEVIAEAEEYDKYDDPFYIPQ